MFEFGNIHRPVAIWGTGVEAAYIYYQLSKDGREAEVFFDNRIIGTGNFLDKRVIQPSSEHIRGGDSIFLFHANIQLIQVYQNSYRAGA